MPAKTTNTRQSAVWEDSTGAGTNSPDTVYEDYGLLPKILNTDKIVKISPHLFKVDLINEQVLVLDEANEGDYPDLTASNLANPNIIVFSTEDDVLSLLDQGSTGGIQNNTWFLEKGLNLNGCQDDYATNDKDKDVGNKDKRHRTKGDVAYQTGGIYFSLKAEGRAQKRLFRIWWRHGITVSLAYRVAYDVRCDSNDQPLITGNSSGVGRHKHRFYESSMALKAYYLYALWHSANGNVRALEIESN